MAVTYKKNWAAAAELHATNAYGGTDADLAADQEYDYTGDIDLETAGQEGAQVLIEFQGSNQKDDLIVDVFAGLDGSIFDTEPFIRKILRNDGSPRAATIVIKDVAHARIGVKTSDTNTMFDYRITHQRWNLIDNST